MSLPYDAEFFKALEPMIPLIESAPKPAVYDIDGRRDGIEKMLAPFLDNYPDAPDVEQTLYHIEAADGHKIAVYAFTKKGPTTAPTSAILHCHAGGMILGSVKLFAKWLANSADQTSIPHFSVDYRLAPEHTNTSLVNDCYAGLEWLSQNAKQFNVDPARIAVMGESAGGGLAAGVALMARDKKLQPPLAKQILIYPMLDDRNVIPNKAMEPFAVWKNDDNITGWSALLGKEKAGKPDADVSPYAAPARAESVAGLPPTYIDVGGLDIFRDEDIKYASRLAAENIQTEFHLYPGVPHVFAVYAPEASVTKRALENRLKAMLSF